MNLVPVRCARWRRPASARAPSPAPPRARRAGGGQAQGGSGRQAQGDHQAEAGRKEGCERQRQGREAQNGASLPGGATGARQQEGGEENRAALERASRAEDRGAREELPPALGEGSEAKEGCLECGE